MHVAKNIKAVFTKELKGYFFSLSSYIFIIIFLTIISWLYFQDLFLLGQTSMRPLFNLLPWFFLFLVPALSMKIWSEEKRQGTLETLLVLPMFEWQLVLAKFFAAFLFLGVSLLFSVSIPITLSFLGDIDTGQVLGSYVGSWLLGGSFLALGQYVSSLTKNQIVAFLITIAASAVLVFIGLPFVLIRAGVLQGVFHTLSIITHFENMAIGVIDLRDFMYYLSLIGVFLYLNVYTLVQRHWK